MKICTSMYIVCFNFTTINTPTIQNMIILLLIIISFTF